MQINLEVLQLPKIAFFFFPLGVEWGREFLPLLVSCFATSSVIVDFASRKIQDLGPVCKVLEKSIWNGCFEIFFLILSTKRCFELFRSRP